MARLIRNVLVSLLYWALVACCMLILTLIGRRPWRMREVRPSARVPFRRAGGGGQDQVVQ